MVHGLKISMMQSPVEGGLPEPLLTLVLVVVVVLLDDDFVQTWTLLSGQTSKLRREE